MAGLTGVLVAAAVSLAWCFFAIWLGPRVGFVDQPDDSELKAHERPAVPLGGVGLFLGLHLGSLIAGVFDRRLLLATAIMLALGLADDRLDLPPLLRLVAEITAAVVVVADIYSLDNGPAPLIVGTILVVFAINAVNLFDGLDGLAGSVGLVSALGLAAFTFGSGVEVNTAIILAAALAGFLVLNWHPARVFLGDSGAYVLGLTLAYLMLDVSSQAEELLVAAGLLGLFALDLLVTLIRRIRESRPLFLGDRGHIYDQMRDRGMAVPRIALVAAAVQVVIVAAVVAVERWLDGWTAVAAVAAIGLVSLAALARQGFLGGRS